MFNLKNIIKHNNIITARVEPWTPKDKSFDIEVDIDKHTIIKMSLDNDDIEVEMYANKARNKLCSLAEEAQRTNTKTPLYASVATH